MKEEEIRPSKVFDEYLRLAAEDAIFYFSEVEKEEISCPACSQKGELAFLKHGFRYDYCINCSTLYVNPRPIASTFNRYYQESPSSKYWATTFYKITAEARRDKIWKEKALMIQEILGTYSDNSNPLLVDIGGGYGIFSEEMRGITGLSPIVIEPNPHLAKVCREKGFMVIEKFLEHVTTEDLPHQNKAYVSFELFEHLHNPAEFLKTLLKMMSKNDIFIFTTLSGSGLDIQTLWEHSKAVMPPHHLNFFNPRSIEILLKKNGFKLLKVFTPGKLDIDIMTKNLPFIKDRFWRTFIKMATDDQKAFCQEWIANQGWSSHMWVICQKF